MKTSRLNAKRLLKKIIAAGGCCTCTSTCTCCNCNDDGSGGTCA